MVEPDFLRLDCYRRAVFDGVVDFFDFVVCDGDAAGGPVLPFMPELKEESFYLNSPKPSPIKALMAMTSAAYMFTSKPKWIVAETFR